MAKRGLAYEKGQRSFTSGQSETCVTGLAFEGCRDLSREQSNANGIELSLDYFKVKSLFRHIPYQVAITILHAGAYKNNMYLKLCAILLCTLSKVPAEVTLGHRLCRYALTVHSRLNSSG